MGGYLGEAAVPVRATSEYVGGAGLGGRIIHRALRGEVSLHDIEDAVTVDIEKVKRAAAGPAALVTRLHAAAVPVSLQAVEGGLAREQQQTQRRNIRARKAAVAFAQIKISKPGGGPGRGAAPGIGCKGPAVPQDVADAVAVEVRYDGNVAAVALE